MVTERRQAGKHLKPYQGLKLPPDLSMPASTSRRKTPKTLSGIETDVLATGRLLIGAGKHLKPYQGLKPAIANWDAPGPSRKTPKTLSGIETELFVLQNTGNAQSRKTPKTLSGIETY